MSNRAKRLKISNRGLTVRKAGLFDFSGLQHDEIVAQLAEPHRYKPALQKLMRLGPAAMDALRRGLGHEHAAVRIGCIRVLDRCMDDAALPELIANLDHSDDGVRAAALHTLACDRCKEGACRPAEATVIPRVAQMLLEDESVDVRAMAADMLGPSVRRNRIAADAIDQAHRIEATTRVRKILSWWIPGGPRYNKLKPSADFR